MRLLSRPSSVDRTGRAIVLMPGPYDSRGKKVNEVKRYDVFGSHSCSFTTPMRIVNMPTTARATSACWIKLSIRLQPTAGLLWI